MSPIRELIQKYLLLDPQTRKDCNEELHEELRTFDPEHLRSALREILDSKWDDIMEPVLVISTLGSISDEVAVPLLCSILEQDNSLPRVKRQILLLSVVKALGKIGSPTAVEPLIRVLNDKRNIVLTKDIATTLAEIGDARAIAPLQEIYEEEVTQAEASELYSPIPEHLEKCIQKLKGLA